MENKNRSLSARLNPANLKFTHKIFLLVLLIVVMVILVYFSIGLRTLHRSLLNNTGKQLEELNYTKISELKVELGRMGDRMTVLAEKDERVYNASAELIQGFLTLADDLGNHSGTESASAINTAITDFYSDSLAPYLPLSGNKVSNYKPVDWNTALGQYLYIVQNPSVPGEKEQLSDIEDYCSYGQAHGSYHPYFLKLAKEFEASDMYLIDPVTGYVVYSLEKNIDFGTNLFNGRFENDVLADAFHKALILSPGDIYLSDMSRYMPAFDKTVCFLSVPVFDFNSMIAVLVVQFDHKLIDQILFDESFLAEGNTLEYTLIGSDLMLRSNPGDYLRESGDYVEKALRKVKRGDRNELQKVAETGSFVLYLDYPGKHKKLLLEGGIIDVKDYQDHRVIASSEGFDLLGQKYWLITKMDRSEILSPFHRQLILYVVITLIILTVIFFSLRIFGRSFSSRLNHLLDAMKLLTGGEKSHSLNRGAEDEVGDTMEAFNRLRKRINTAEEFAIEMSEGNYNYQFEVLSERDSLGKSLNVLKDKLIQSKEEHETRAREDEIRNWINSGIAKFNDLLRQNNDNIQLLAYSLIENMIEYLDAQVGGVFLVEGEAEDTKSIELIAAYAYDRRKYDKKKQSAREGLLGACYLEKKSIYLKEIPEDYIDIVSGLGHKMPKCLYIVPLKVDEQVLGIIEIASFTEFSVHQIEFIDQVANSIAATFVSVRLNMKTAALLEESNSRAEEIAQQEEEMRQNLEEMQATQEELARLRQDDEKRTQEMQLIVDNTKSMMKSLLDAIPGGYSLKDQNGIVHLINSEGAKYYGLSVDRIVGKTDHELLPAKLYEQEHKRDISTIDEGEQSYTETVELKEESITYHVIKKPFMISGIGQQGILTIRTIAE